MAINELIKKYVDEGYRIFDARNLAAQEIILTKLSNSSLSEHVTLKGGIVMFNLSKKKRHVTQDIDLDFIRYSIDDNGLRLFVDKLNAFNDDYKIFIKGKPELLNHEDYHGVRLHAIIDDCKDRLHFKFDIGVHTYTAIEQENLFFQFDKTDSRLCLKVNSPDQIISEKLISLSKLGSFSSRYKDIYDVYFLILNNLVSLNNVKKIIGLFLTNSKKGPKNVFDFVVSIEDVLNNENFIHEASKQKYNWVGVDFALIKETIINFIFKF